MKSPFPPYRFEITSEIYGNFGLSRVKSPGEIAMQLLKGSGGAS